MVEATSDKTTEMLGSEYHGSMETLEFQELPLDKWEWHPSPFPGQIVYVTTWGVGEVLDLAPKSWVSMAAFHGPIVGFGCSEKHQTYANVQSTGRFTLNFPTFEQAALASVIAEAPREERLAISGLGAIPSPDRGVPHLAKCPAYAECRLVETTRFEGGEVFLFGKVERLAVRADVAEIAGSEAYAKLAPAFFLEPGVMGRLVSDSDGRNDPQ